MGAVLGLVVAGEWSAWPGSGSGALACCGYRLPWRVRAVVVGVGGLSAAARGGGPARGGARVGGRGRGGAGGAVVLLGWAGAGPGGRPGVVCAGCRGLGGAGGAGAGGVGADRGRIRRGRADD